jgi:uroporphyrinogen decarboxylase
MNSRERVYAAVNHKEPDRVPISFGGAGGNFITECPPNGRVCSELYEHLGLTDAEPIKISDVFTQPTNIDPRVIERLHSDMLWVGCNPPPPTVEADGTKTWPWFGGMRIRKVGLYDEPFDFPLRNMTTKADIDAYPWPDTSANVLEGVVERARYLHEETDYFVVGRCISMMLPFLGYALLSGMDKWLMDMKLDPKFYHQLSEKLLEIGLEVNEQFLGGISKYLDAVNIMDDLGTQEALFMSHDDYVEFVKPYTAEIIKHVRKHIRPEAKVLIHSCGSVYKAIPDLIEIGVDILNPVQPLPRNMEPWRLKKEFGKDIVFCGGFDIQQLLPQATPEEVREGAKKLIQEYAPGGGFIFGTAHNIEPFTPPENIVAAFDAAYEYGKYPISEPSGESYVEFIKGLNLQGRKLGMK